MSRALEATARRKKAGIFGATGRVPVGTKPARDYFRLARTLYNRPSCTGTTARLYGSGLPFVGTSHEERVREGPDVEGVSMDLPPWCSATDGPLALVRANTRMASVRVTADTRSELESLRLRHPVVVRAEAAVLADEHLSGFLIAL